MILGNISQKIEGCQPRGGVFEVSAALGYARGDLSGDRTGKTRHGLFQPGGEARRAPKRRIGLPHFRNAACFTTWVPERACATLPTRLSQCSSGDRQAIRIVCAIAQTISYEPAAISLSEKALATA